MPTIAVTPEWTISASGDLARFTRPQPGDAVYTAPRVWHGRGLALPETDLLVFGTALGKIMKLAAYWSARARAAGDRGPTWAAPRYDPDDGFVYIAGPARLPGATAGYRPTPVFDLDLGRLRDLRIRVAAYLSAAPDRVSPLARRPTPERAPKHRSASHR